MPESDNKPRGVQIREASRLRATLGSEPSSGYAFHDHVRVERVRPGQREPAAQVGSNAQHERPFARTLVGGVMIQGAPGLEAHELNTEPPLPVEANPSAPPAANDQGEESGARMSWPPMPQVPSELEGSIVDALPGLTESAEADVPTGVRPSASSSAPAKPVSSGPPAAAIPAGGAIWQAMPSLVDAPLAIERISSRDSAPELRSTPRPSEPGKALHSNPAAQRPSAAELEAEYAHSYGDPRVLKYEKLVERNAWEQLAEQLGKESELSPALLLLRIVAQREMLKGDQKAEAARLAQQGISAMARVLQLPEASPTALVLGKRLLRRNPGWAPQRHAGRQLSIGLLLGGVTIGAAIGWLITALFL